MIKNILLIHDMAGYGKISLGAMLPILSHMKFSVCNLPTALVSNTLEYGKFEILETTDYMKNSIEVWKELGFEFDAISTGMMVSERQVKLVCDFCLENKAKGVKIFVDPIMGDDGVLYNGITQESVDYTRKMCTVADVIMPNYTEATFLADMFQGRERLSHSETDQLLEKLKTICPGSIIITSTNVAGQTCTIVYDKDQDKTVFVPYERIDAAFPGTGDIFSAVLTGNYLNGVSLLESTKRAMNTVAKVIELSKNNDDKYKGVLIEQYLSEIQC